MIYAGWYNFFLLSFSFTRSDLWFYCKWKMYVNMIFKCFWLFFLLFFFWYMSRARYEKNIAARQKLSRQKPKEEDWNFIPVAFHHLRDLIILLKQKAGREREEERRLGKHTLKCYLCIITDYYVDEKIIKKFTTMVVEGICMMCEFFSHKNIYDIFDCRRRDRFYEFSLMNSTITWLYNICR